MLGKRHSASSGDNYRECWRLWKSEKLKYPLKKIAGSYFWPFVALGKFGSSLDRLPIFSREDGNLVVHIKSFLFKCWLMFFPLKRHIGQNQGPRNTCSIGSICWFTHSEVRRQEAESIGVRG